MLVSFSRGPAHTIVAVLVLLAAGWHLTSAADVRSELCKIVATSHALSKEGYLQCQRSLHQLMPSRQFVPDLCHVSVGEQNQLTPWKHHRNADINKYCSCICLKQVSIAPGRQENKLKLGATKWTGWREGPPALPLLASNW